MTTSKLQIAKPSQRIGSISYENECREALRGPVDALLDAAAQAGWDRRRAAFELMYLASNASAIEKG